jgi:sialic acid synthase SpsE
VPLLDEHGHLVAVAVNRSDAFQVGRHDVGRGNPAFLIAEIGINHNGSVPLAKELVDLAKTAGADCVKFQLRDMAALYRGGNRYEVRFEPLADFGNVDSMSRAQRDAAVREAIAEYVRRLEKCAREAPDNWFNFHDFWGGTP